VNSRAEYSNPAVRDFSNIQPIWQLILLHIATAGLYAIYWFYRNWSQLKYHKDLKINPVLRTLGLFVPILNVVLIYKQFKQINDFADEAGIDKTYPPIATLGGLLGFAALGKLPDPFWLLSFLSVLPLALVQTTINSYWHIEEPCLRIRKHPSIGQIVILIIGAIFWAFALVGLFLPA